MDGVHNNTITGVVVVKAREGIFKSWYFVIGMKTMATVIDRRGMQHGGVAKEKRIEIENIFIITGAGQTYLHLDARALL